MIPPEPHTEQMEPANLVGTSTRRPTLPDVLDHGSGLVSAVRDRFFTKRTRNDSILWPDAASRLATAFGGDADAILREPALRDVEVRTRALLADIRGEDPFRNRWASDAVFAAACYLACRLVQPETVVETGVAYGVSSAYILAALRQNGRGTLHSIDLLPLRRRAANFQGIAVAERDRCNWNIHHGPSRRILPGLLRQVGGLDLFLHDSLHTLSNMAFEFDTALRHLRPGGMILADDVERNVAFRDLLRRITGNGIYDGLGFIVADREVKPLHGRPAPAEFGIAVPEPTGIIGHPSGNPSV